MKITLAIAQAPRQVAEQVLELSEGATVADALRAASLEPLPGEFAAGVWGRPVTLLQRLQDGDRIDLCRGLRVDPKVARRERFQRQGSKTAGLFAKRRTGGKPGY